MPLNPTQLAEVYTSALGSIRAGRGDADLGEVARSLWQRLAPTEPFANFWTVVQAADRNWRESTELNANTTAVPRPRDVPIDPTINSSDGAFGYRVVVTVTDAQGQSIDTVVMVYSDRPLAGEEVMALAASEVMSGQGDFGYRNQIGAMSGPSVTGTHIISGGRAR